MPRLARLRLVNIGHPNARFDDLTLDFRSHDLALPTDAILWLRNGGGKTSLLALFFALVRPGRRDFLRYTAGGTLEDYVLENDRSAVIAEWELDTGGSLFNDIGLRPLFLTGVYHERASSSVDTSVHSLFFAARVVTG